MPAVHAGWRSVLGPRTRRARRHRDGAAAARAVGAGRLSASPGGALDPQRLRRRRRALRDARGRHGPRRVRDRRSHRDRLGGHGVGPGPGRRQGTSCTSATSATTTPCGRPSRCTGCAEPAETPAAPGSPLTGVEALQLTYPDGPSDAEVLLVDPTTGDLVIVTKSLLGASRVFEAAAASLVAGAPIPMVDAGGLDRARCRRNRAAGCPAPCSPAATCHRTGRSSCSAPTARCSCTSAPTTSRSPRPCRVSPASDSKRRSRKAKRSPSPVTARPMSRRAKAPTCRSTASGCLSRWPRRRRTHRARRRLTEAVDDDDGATIGAALIGGAALLLALGAGALFLSRRRRSGAG